MGVGEKEDSMGTGAVKILIVERTAMGMMFVMKHDGVWVAVGFWSSTDSETSMRIVLGNLRTR